jgi:hypothetical protein
LTSHVLLAVAPGQSVTVQLVRQRAQVAERNAVGFPLDATDFHIIQRKVDEAGAGAVELIIRVRRLLERCRGRGSGLKV